MRRYWRAPLPWVTNLDADRTSELLIWDSFPLDETASMAAYGLMAWVYKLGADETFILDLRLSRQMAAEIAEELTVLARWRPESWRTLHKNDAGLHRDVRPTIRNANPRQED